MAIEFLCSGCGGRLIAQDEHAGRDIRCAECDAVTRVPDVAQLPDVDRSPYASPTTEASRLGVTRKDALVLAAERLRVPAICLLVAAGLGILTSLFGILVSLSMGPMPPDPNVPEWFRESFRPISAAVNVGFLVLKIVIVVGCAKMFTLRSHGWAMTGAILSLIPVDSCCCPLTFPFGIWALVVLTRPDVKAAFRAA